MSEKGKGSKHKSSGNNDAATEKRSKSCHEHDVSPPTKSARNDQDKIESETDNVIGQKLDELTKLFGDLKDRMGQLERAQKGKDSESSPEPRPGPSKDTDKVSVSDQPKAKDSQEQGHSFPSFELSEDSDASEDDGVDDDAFENFFVSDDKSGPAVDDKIAANINAGLCLSADKEMLNSVVQKFKRPSNIPNLKNPKVNKEIRIRKPSVKFREQRLGKIQTCIEKGIVAITKVMHEVKTGRKEKSPLNAKDIYEFASDSMKLLVTAHKDMSQVRRENLRAALPPQQRDICDPRQWDRIENNDFLFGKDYTKTIEDLNKARRTLTGSKNMTGGRFYRPRNTQNYGRKYAWKKHGQGYRMKGGKTKSQ